MRWKAIYILLVLMVFIGIIGFFFFDNILSWTIEKSLETTIGAKVDLQKLHLDLWNLKITIGDLRITNPNNTWRNLIETKNISFQMAPIPLFSGKIVIEEIAMEDLMIDSPRKTDGQIKKVYLPGPLGQAQAKLNNDIASLPVLNPEVLQKQISTDKLFASYQLKTNFSAELVRKQIEESNRKWQDNIKKVDETKEKIQELQKKLNKFLASQPKNLLELRDKIQDLEKMQKSAQNIQTQVNQTGDSFNNEYTELKRSIQDLKDTAEADYKALLSLAKFPDFKSINVAEVLFGKTLLNESTLAVDLADKLQKMVPVSLESPPKEQHPRGGQDIVFPGRKTYPNFLIKQVRISTKGSPDSIFKGYYAEGTALGITDQPQIYGLPMKVNVSGTAPNNAYMQLDGNLNHLTSNINDQLNLTLGKIPLSTINLAINPLLPDKIESGHANVLTSLNIKPEDFKLNMVIEGRNLNCSYRNKKRKSSNDLVSDIIRETLSKVDQFTIYYQLESVSGKMKMKISSDIDQIINNRMKEVIGVKIEQATKEIRQQVDVELQKNQQKLNSLVNQYQAELAANINQVNLMIEQERKKVEKAQKDLEKQLKKQLKIK